MKRGMYEYNIPKNEFKKIGASVQTTSKFQDRFLTQTWKELMLSISRLDVIEAVL